MVGLKKSESSTVGAVMSSDNYLTNLYSSIIVLDETASMIAASTIDIIPKANDNEPLEVMMAAGNRDSEIWLCDTGSGRHICANRKYFINLRMYGPDDEVVGWHTSAPNGRGQPVGFGKVKLALLQPDGRINKLIFDAEYCPGLRFNIFGACRARRELGLAYNDITFKIHDVFNNNKPVGGCYFHNGLPFLKHTGVLPSVMPVIPALLAHRRLRHIGKKRGRTNTDRLDDDITTEDFNCESCKQGKSK